VADSEGNVKDVKTSGMDRPDDREPAPEGGKALSRQKRVSTASPPVTELGRSSWIPPRIQTIASKALAYRFALPEELRNRVRAEMLQADADFLHEEKSHELKSYEREVLAIRWICRILGVFAEEACSLVRSGDPAWRPSQVETRVDEVLRLLTLEAECSKSGGGDKLYLTQSGHVSASALATISRSSEWSQYIQALESLLVRRAGSSVAHIGVGEQAGERRGGDGLKSKGNAYEVRFPGRAAWLKERLHERGWNKHDVSRQNGPYHRSMLAPVKPPSS
jgi:hypothetical protein